MTATATTQPPTDVAGFDPTANAGDAWYDEEAADQVVTFFTRALVHTKAPWAGKPFTLELWQENYLRTLFGWKRPDGTRRFRVSFLFIPRKNGKSQIAAGIALFMLLVATGDEAQCYCAAGNRDQASLVFRAAQSMAFKSPSLEKRVRLNKTSRTLTHRQRMSFLRAIPADDSSAHGFNVDAVIGDELHVWPNRHLFDTLHTGTGAAGDPLEVYITTAGFDQTSICYEVYKRARAVRDGEIDDPSFLPAVYEAEHEDDWTDPATWKKANPNLGVSIREEYIREECQKAQENPAYENTFRRLHLNQWVGQESRWLQMNHWDACYTTEEPIDDGSPIYSGLDLSQTRDFTAFVVVTPANTGFKCWGHYWLPEDRIEQLEREHNIPLSAWIRGGWVTPCPGRTIEYGPIHSHIVEVSKRYDLRAVGFDPYNAHATRIELEDQHGIEMVEMRQGVPTLSGPSKQLERCVLEHTLDHSGDPVLRWMADNVAVKVDENGNIKPVKSVQGHRRQIDGIVALVMAIGQAEAHEEAAPSIFSDGAFL